MYINCSTCIMAPSVRVCACVCESMRVYVYVHIVVNRVDLVRIMCDWKSFVCTNDNDIAVY